MTEQSTINFDGRVAIVTGAASGMGREHALMLASRGARVVVNDISPKAADAVAAITDAGGTAVANTSDITTNAARLVQTAIDAFGQLDIVVNNAGIFIPGSFAEQDPADWWKVFDTHVRGTTEVSRAAWPHLARSGDGRLINIASSGILGSPFASAYSAAKGAIWGLGNSLSKEGPDVGIQVTTVLPSAYTPMTAGAFDDPTVLEALEEQMPASAIAAFVAWLAHSDTQANGNSFSISGTGAARGDFATMPRVRAASPTPEGWQQVAAELLQDRDELTPVRSSGELFRAEFVFLAPELDAVLPGDPARPTNK
jgi:NAD(P)-dependent dehydrogenase (short-subunit alcohol dehydrogenase family)